jgi:hypothetical protein
MTVAGHRPAISRVVDIIEAASRDGLGDEAIISRLEEVGLCGEHGRDALETVRAGFGRAQLYAMGMRPGQLGGDFEDDPLFLAAVERVVGTRPAHAGKRRPWWKFW